MDWSAQLDSTRGASPILRRLILLFVLSSFALACERLEEALSLARSENLAEARAILESCAAAEPREKRYPLELAGIAYLAKNFGLARKRLRQALALEPNEPYAHEFLGTLYYLDSNLEAALLHWNRVGKPVLQAVDTSQASLDPKLLNSLITFGPGDVLSIQDYRTTRNRLIAMGLQEEWIRLQAVPPAGYNLQLTAQPNELGWATALRALRGLPYRALTPELRNWNGSGWSAESLLRWDAQKRRAAFALEAPAFSSAKWRWNANADVRRETWNIGEFTDFRLNSTSLRGGLTAIERGGWRWWTRAGFTTRDYQSVRFAGGETLELEAGADASLLSLPGRRFAIGAQGRGQFGRWFRDSGSIYTRWRGDLSATWFPKAQGEDLALRARVSTGAIGGALPFDRLFNLGVERDTDLWLRGHAATRNGKKGSGWIGRQYLLANVEWEQQIASGPFVSVRLGPILDVGAIQDFRTGRQYAIDGGLQLRIVVAGKISLALSWAQDLRGGKPVFYLSNGLFTNEPRGIEFY